MPHIKRLRALITRNACRQPKWVMTACVHSGWMMAPTAPHANKRPRARPIDLSNQPCTNLARLNSDAPAAVIISKVPAKLQQDYLAALAAANNGPSWKDIIEAGV